MDSPSTIYNEGGPLSLESAVHASYNPLSGPQSWYNAGGFSTPNNQQPFQSSDMAQDPATGLWVNRNTGQIYSDPQGQRPVSNLDLQHLTARAVGVSNNLYGQAAGTNAGFNGAVGAQKGFARSLNDVINGTAPSVAQDQLYQTLDSIRRNQLSQAAGTSGQNMVLANQNAMNNTAAASIDAGNAAATLRAQEAATARAQQGNTLGAITGAYGNQYATQLGAAGGAGQQALQSQSKNTELDQENKEKNKDLAVQGASKIGGGLLAAFG